MFYSVTNGFLMFLIISNRQMLISCNDNEDLIFRLNGILSHPGWKQIDHIEGKHQLSAYSFSGINLFIPIEEPDNFYVTEENVYEKYWMTARLMECVYAKAILDYLSYIRLILYEITREGKRVSNILRCRMHRQKNSKAKRPRAKGSPLNYEKFWDLLDLALGQRGNSYMMFDCIIDAMSFLEDSLSELRGGQCDSSIQLIKRSVFLIRNVKQTLNEYNDDNRYKFNLKISVIPSMVKKFFTCHIVSKLIRFTFKYCVMLKIANTSEPQTLCVDQDCTIHSVEDAQLEIENLINKVYNNYYRALGFLKEEILM